MIPFRRIRPGLALLALLALPPLAMAATPPTIPDFTPDPASVERYGPAYRYPQAGWIVLHIEGDPYERGYQHGRLLAPEIADYVKTLANMRSTRGPGDAWRGVRTMVDALFLRQIDREYLEEMKGIADGAAAAGAKFEGRAIDLLDIAAANSEMETMCLEGALEATANGLEGERFKEPPSGRPSAPKEDHCSAFAAVGPATADGKVVIGHITMFGLYAVRHFNVWLDVKPTRGHRVLMQSYPGGIQSGMDYYQNDNGLVVVETTLDQTRFDVAGRSLASRIRRALQYADSIDDAAKILAEGNNGLYTNEWLIADTKANEIAMFELGTHRTKLWRSSKGEWFGGTEGFYWGCNNTKDLDVRLETVASVEGKPSNVVFHPSPRDEKWVELYRRNKGKITADFGFEAFTTAPLAASSSCDAKFTTTELARDLKAYALFGPPRGRTWDATEWERRQYADIRPLVSNDWTVLRADAVAPPSSGSNGSASKAVDLAKNSDADSAPQRSGRRRRGDMTLPPAWRGTLLPGSDADTWLAAGFAGYEHIAALEKSLKAQAKGGKLDDDDRDRIDLALFAPRVGYLAAVRRLGRDVPLSGTKADVASDAWYQIAANKGVLLLADLRSKMGDEKFDAFMDDFGRAHAGKPASTAAFREAAEKAYGKPLGDFFNTWLTGNGLPKPGPGGSWTTSAFEAEPEHALIVYGTKKDVHAQREAAERLQHAIARRFYNLEVPIKADTEVTADDRENHHLILVGRPEANAVSARCAEALPVTFGPGSFTVSGKTYANAASAVIAAGPNPRNPRYSVVIFAGLGADATWHCVEQASFQGPTEVLLLAAGESPKRLLVPRDGKVAPGLVDKADAR